MIPGAKSDVIKHVLIAVNQLATLTGHVMESTYLRFLFRRYLSWSVVRSVAELAILARASFLLLFFVPILAGLWPTFKAAVDYYNGIAQEAEVRLEGLTHQVETLASDIRRLQLPESAASTAFVKKAIDAADHAEEAATSILKATKIKQVVSPRLPRSWELAYFAAVAAFAAQMIYQLFSPRIIKESSRSSHASATLRDYLDAPTVGKYEHARSCLQKAEINGIPLRYYGIDAGPPTKLARSYDGSNSTQLAEYEERQQLRRDGEVVWVGATAEYDVAAGEMPPMCIVAMVLYGISVVLLSTIIISQAQLVYLAAHS